MTELSKKLSMKKTFFVTQLESFFNTITSEFQERVSSLEIENKLLKEQNEKLNYDVKNLVEIKNRLQMENEDLQADKKHLKDEIESLKTISNDERNITLLRENNKLKKESDALAMEVASLKEKINNLQAFVQKGGAYSQSILEQKKEDVIKEISKNMTK